MMKTGIITYHNTRNCGAALQAYALQQTLNSLGCDCDIIDYRCEKIDSAYKLKKLYEIKSLKEFIKWILTIKNDSTSQKKFEFFWKQYLNISKPYNKENIALANDAYDAFVAGSDQIWNFNLNGGDFTYLLNFVKDKKKISYAGSAGGFLHDEEGFKKIADALKKFDAVSVREKDINKCMTDEFNINSEMVLDPTLLLKKDDYDFSEKSVAPKEKYIFVYTIASTPNIEKAARLLSEKTGLKIIWGHLSYRKKKGVINKTAISPDEFVSYIKNAEYVLTSSFHGMAFSVILEKQFFYDLDTKKINNNSRLETLSELLELTDRELKENNADILEKSEIDYQKVSEKLQIYRDKSIGFLRKNI